VRAHPAGVVAVRPASLIVALAFAAPMATAGAACSSSTPSADPTGSCREIARACHPHDTGSGIAHECHELGHDGNDALCAPRRDECLAACPPREAGSDAGAETPEEDAATDAPGDVEQDPCPAHCACMVETCSSQPGYPCADESQCLAACAAHTSEQKECWPKFCARAKRCFARSPSPRPSMSRSTGSSASSACAPTWQPTAELRWDEVELAVSDLPVELDLGDEDIDYDGLYGEGRR
jgi:hypothetical protein